MKAAIRLLACAIARPLAGRLSRGGLAALLIAAAFLPGAPAAQSALAAQPALQEVTSTLRPEVRLRKLHLVRPDLIMYPLAYDVYC